MQTSASKSLSEQRPLVVGSLKLEKIRDGKVIEVRAFYNLIPTVGKALISGLLIATGTAATHIAIGTGASGPVAGDTALTTETHRASATRSQVTTSTTNDTAQYEVTISMSGSYDITEAGLLNSGSGGTLQAIQNFTAVELIPGDSIRVTWKFQV